MINIIKWIKQSIAFYQGYKLDCVCRSCALLKFWYSESIYYCYYLESQEIEEDCCDHFRRKK
jgi:hypothetical protein